MGNPLLVLTDGEMRRFVTRDLQRASGTSLEPDLFDVNDRCRPPAPFRRPLPEGLVRV